MLFGRHIRAINTDVSRRAPGRYVARGCVALGLSAIALVTLGLDASAAGVLSLRFPSQTVVADGINATPVMILVEVVSTATSNQVNGVTGNLTWTASGSAAATDLSTVGTAVVNTPGYLFAGFSPFYTGTNSNVQPVPWGVDSNAGPILASGTTSIAAINLRVAAGVTSGTFSVSFATGVGNSFQQSILPFASFSYLNGNDNASFGVITVVPEPSTGTALGAATILMAGVGFVQQRMRRKSRTVELVG